MTFRGRKREKVCVYIHACMLICATKFEFHAYYTVHADQNQHICMCLNLTKNTEVYKRLTGLKWWKFSEPNSMHMLRSKNYYNALKSLSIHKRKKGHQIWVNLTRQVSYLRRKHLQPILTSHEVPRLRLVMAWNRSSKPI